MSLRSGPDADVDYDDGLPEDLVHCGDCHCVLEVADAEEIDGILYCSDCAGKDATCRDCLSTRPRIYLSDGRCGACETYRDQMEAAQ